MADEKKLIIDDDWKSQAQKEKEQLEQQAAQSAQRPPLPQAGFEELVGMFGTQAMLALGLIRTQQDKDKDIPPDLELARFYIDMLGMLEEKTKGNLSAEEQSMLSTTLGQLRMIFVQLASKFQQP